MTQDSGASAAAAGKAKGIGNGYLFGMPIGDLGWFATLLMGTAAGFAAFFLATFCAIVSILVWNGATHAQIDYALSYRRVGLPVGLFVLVGALGLLGTMWVRRILRKA